MVLGVKKTIAIVCDLELRSYNMARAPKGPGGILLSIYSHQQTIL